MDKSAPPGAAARPPGAEGTVHVRQVICNAGDSLGPFLTPVLHAGPASLVDQTAVSTRLVRPIRPVWSTRLESCKPDQTGLVGACRSISSGRAAKHRAVLGTDRRAGPVWSTSLVDRTGPADRAEQVLGTGL